jgi:hypothetical protein
VELLASSILTFRRIFGGALSKMKVTLCRRIPSVIDLCSMVDIYCYLGALVIVVMNLRVSQNVGNFLASLGPFTFSQEEYFFMQLYADPEQLAHS